MAEELCVRLVPLFNQLSLKRQRQVERLVHHQRPPGDDRCQPG